MSEWACVCVRVCVGAQVHVCVCTHERGSQRSTLDVVPQEPLTWLAVVYFVGLLVVILCVGVFCMRVYLCTT